MDISQHYTQYFRKRAINYNLLKSHQIYLKDNIYEIPVINTLSYWILTIKIIIYFSSVYMAKYR
ncbi:membrane-bound lytic transglycosylase MltB_2 family [Ehrlichia ruminantium]|uniref:Membrane-bound lytic transglycosylase MltB_2 family n=1 Tax=Ehrlichia ruminantium TaxID=779 RepID=A0A170RUM2_EHRRU|nr:membrane-bound lytic transglycosylase MltB_2 family [Ehrlichia ruminantium]GAT77239.1 membrane-bound lytic transglycosylase MltB_2 family [Ehrlichia ruminantium]GAT78391.1 membrane-bound lytic transglycosylase MltB_2 family [Ehrlichia ruminantium]